MKKVILVAALGIFGMAGTASAYQFEDLIDYWNISGTSYGEEQTLSHNWDSVSLSENDSLFYIHDINDSVNFANGHYVTDASLELDFTNDEYDGYIYIPTGWFSGYFSSQEEHVYYNFDSTGWNYLGEVDNGQHDVMLDLSLLNDNGQLAVQIGVSNWGAGNTDAWLDHSRLYGEAVPEPSTMLLMGLGLAGLVGYNRKRK